MARIGKAEEPSQITWDLETDLVVVGGGGAGFCAAIEAAEAGCSVLVLEKNSWCGGDSYMCGGHIMCAGHPLQEKLAGVTEDSGERFADDIIRWGQGLVDEAMVREMCKDSAACVDYMIDLGREFTRIEYVNPVRQLDEGHPAYPRVVVSDGSYYGVHFPPIEAKLNSLENAVVMTETPARHLVRDDEGRVIGVQAEDSSGGIFYARAKKGVILASAGSDHDLDLARSLSRQQYWGLRMLEDGKGNPGCFDTEANTGDGVRMAMEIGANLAVSSACVMQDVHYVGGVGDYGMHAALGLEANPYNSTVFNGNILVNPRGKRFVQEDAVWGFVMHQVADELDRCGVNYATLDKNCWYVADHDHFVPTWESMGYDQTYMVEADTLEELAGKMGVSADALCETVERWNGFSDAQNDSDFGRWGDWGRIETPPFHADIVRPGVLGTAAGVKCDIDTRVIDINGVAIPGLYAAGMIAGGNYTPPFYPGCGWAILGTIHWGRKAGRVVAAQ